MINPLYTVVSFFTPEYSDCAAEFERAAVTFGLPCVLEPMPSKGNWEDNTGLKPKALIYLRARLRGPLMYLDVDTLLLKAPALPIGEWDVALCENPVKAHLNRIAAQCFFLSDTASACRFIETWAGLVARYGGRDHRQLTNTVATNKTAVIGKADFTGCLRLNGLRPERTQTLA